MIRQRKQMTEADRRRLSARRTMWTHPRRPTLSLPQKTVTALACMQMGLSDHTHIAEVVGLSVEEVADIDAAKDTKVRQLGVAGIPVGEYFTLRKEIRCPRCGANINIAPCVACELFAKRRRRREK